MREPGKDLTRGPMDSSRDSNSDQAFPVPSGPLHPQWVSRASPFFASTTSSPGKSPRSQESACGTGDQPKLAPLPCTVAMTDVLDGLYPVEVRPQCFTCPLAQEHHKLTGIGLNVRVLGIGNLGGCRVRTSLTTTCPGSLSRKKGGHTFDEMCH